MIKWQGITWSIHPLLAIIMLLAALTGYFAELFTLFVLVLVHELGHVVAARSLGWRVRVVMLLPFGGVAEIEETGTATARQEMFVALAGPVQHVWMWLLAWSLGAIGVWDAAWALYVCKANLMLLAFNLLPIYPLDGGKLLQSALSKMTTYYRALVWSAHLSLGASVVMLVSAFYPLWRQEGIQLNLLIVGCFLFVTNWTYRRHIPLIFYRFLMYRNEATEQIVLAGTSASPLIVSAQQPIFSVARLLRRGHYHLICLAEQRGRGVKLLPEQVVVERCLSGGNPGRAVSELFL